MGVTLFEASVTGCGDGELFLDMLLLAPVLLLLLLGF